MTRSLQKAFEKAKSLPEPLQEELAAQLLEEIQGEVQWDPTLASPESQNLLKSMAAEARQAKRDGKVYDQGPDDL